MLAAETPPIACKAAGAVTVSPNPAFRGSEVAITIPSAPPGATSAKLLISGWSELINVPFKGNTATFTIPTDFPLGSYAGIVNVSARSFGLCEPVDVRPFANWVPRLDEFQPAATYDSEEVFICGGKDPVRTARLTLRGGNFLVDHPEDNHIVTNGDELPVDWSGCSKAPDLSTADKAKQIKSVQHFGKVVSPQRIELCGS